MQLAVGISIEVDFYLTLSVPEVVPVCDMYSDVLCSCFSSGLPDRFQEVVRPQSS